MRIHRTFIAVLGLFLFTSVSLGQSGAFGGGASFAGAAAKGDEQIQNLILTPGEQAEITLDAKVNEVIIATVRSDVFDPAVRLVNESSETLAENDDIELGVQTARIIKRIEKAGKHTIYVSGFKGVAGGPFSISISRFTAHPLNDKITNGKSSDSKPVWYFYKSSVKQQIAVATTNTTLSSKESIDSVGTPLNERKYYVNRGVGESFVIDMEADREYYFMLDRTFSEYSIRIAPFTPLPVSTTRTPHVAEIAPGLYSAYKIKAKRGDLIRVVGNSDNPESAIFFEQVEKDDPESTFSSKFECEGELKNRHSKVYLIQDSGTFEIVTANSSRNLGRFETLIAPGAQVLTQDTLVGNLPVGETHYYQFDVGTGYLADVSAFAETFDAVLTFFDSERKEVLNSDDLYGLNPALQYFINLKSTWYVQISSKGRGGGGSYQLNRKLIAPLTFKDEQAVKIDAHKTGVFTITGQKDEIIYIRVQSPAGSVKASFKTQDGYVIERAQIQESENSTVYAVRLTVTGTYHMFLTAESVAVDLKIRRLKLIEQ